MAPGSEDAAHRFAFVRGLARQRRTLAAVTTAISAVLLVLAFAPLGLPAVPPWLALAAVVGYTPSTLLTLVRLSALQARVEGGLEVLVAEKEYQRILLVSNLLFGGVFVAALAVAVALGLRTP